MHHFIVFYSKDQLSAISILLCVCACVSVLVLVKNYIPFFLSSPRSSLVSTIKTSRLLTA